MKNAVIGIVLMTILVLTCAILYGLEGKTTRQNELDANLSAAMKATMETMAIDPVYAIEESEDHMAADFIQNYLVKLNSNSKVEIDILAADAKKGLLSVKATEKYQSVFSESSVSAIRTIIVDMPVEEEKEYYQVSFYQDYDSVTGEYKNPFKQIYLYGGSDISGFTVPEPVRKGFAFKGWRLTGFGTLDGIYTDISSIPVTEDLIFAAEWEEEK